MIKKRLKKRLKRFNKRTTWLVKRARLRTLDYDRTDGKLTLFVTGVQRSGTNMVMQVLERHGLIDVFHEGDLRAFDNYEMRSEGVVRALISKSPFPIVTIKALLEGHKVNDLLDRFAPARAVWMFRHYDDVVNSSLKNWPGWRNKIEDVVRDREQGDWRGLGMSDETYQMVRRLYSPDLDDASANALFWLYRNQLFFDQQLEHSDRILLMSYEWLVQNVDQACRAFCEFVDAKYDDNMGSKVTANSIRKNEPLAIDPEIRILCDAMYDKLMAVWMARDSECIASVI